MDQITELIALADKRIFGSKREEDISAIKSDKIGYGVSRKE
ncbi:hypothetical protein ACQRAF_12285 [Lachnospiraceae bacterium SGI.240]